MKNILVILFPEIEYMGSQTSTIPLFTECIKKRYLDNGYQLVITNYKGSKGFITIAGSRKIEADITFKQSSPYFTEDYKTPNFRNIASNLSIQDASRIVVGGFHCFDCVEKLAQEIYKINKNVIIDSDLTETFPARSRRENFDITKFDPDDKVTRFINSFFTPPPDTLKRVYDSYSNPIWGISNSTLKKLEEMMESTNEKEF